MPRDTRAASPAIGTVLVVVVVVVLAASISVFALGFLDDLREPAPVVAQSSGAFIPQDGTSGGVVLITHEAGETVRIEDIEIAVRADCTSGTRQGRIIDLPAGAGNAIRESDGQITGDNIFDERSLNSIDNAVSEVSDGGALLQTQYTAGDTIMFRIPKGKCELTAGSDVSVRVVHVPSQSTIIDRELTA